MKPFGIHTSVVLAMGLLTQSVVVADENGESSGRAIFGRARQSTVAVGYTLENEQGRTERVTGGVIVSAEGLVMIPLAAVDERIPDPFLKDFRILLTDELGGLREVKAELLGRDPRTEVAFVKATEAQQWVAIRFESRATKIDEQIFSVGLMPAEARYRPYLTRGRVAGVMPGMVDRVLISEGGMGAVGSVVLDEKGVAIGFVNTQAPFPLMLNQKDSMLALVNPLRFFTPAGAFMSSLSDLPSKDKPMALGWAGFTELAGVEPQEAEHLGLKGAAVRINSVLRNGPADRAGLKRDDVVTQINGVALLHGASAQALEHRLMCEKPGTEVRLTVVSAAARVPREVHVTLVARPLAANTAARYWAPEMGLGVREFVPMDREVLNLADDVRGLVVTTIKPRSVASVAKLNASDVICRVDGQPVADIAQFKSVCESARKAEGVKPLQLSVIRAGKELTVACELPR